jgi:integrase
LRPGVKGQEDPRPVIPTKNELQAIVAGAAGRWRPVILVAIFCGLRASELRGLRRTDGPGARSLVRKPWLQAGHQSHCLQQVYSPNIE